MATSPRWTIAKMSSSRAPPARLIGCVEAGRAAPVGAGLGHGAGGLLVGRDPQLVARERDVVEAEHLHRHRRARLGDLLAVLVEHRADLAPAATGDDRVADPQRAPLDERGDDRAAALVEVRLEHEARGPAPSGWRRAPRPRRRAGSTRAARRRRGRRAATTSTTIVSPPHSSGTSSLLDELLADPRRVGVLAVDLGDRDDDRHLGRARVADRLDRSAASRRRRPRRRAPRCRWPARRGRASR